MLPLFWLRVALSLYGVGLLYALASFWGGRKVLTRITLPAVGLGMVFHFVSIIENAMFSGTWTPTSMHGLESLLAFVLMVFFFIVYARYRATSPGLAVFPLVFWLTFSASSYAEPTEPSAPLFVSTQWIYIHVALILVGYSALFFSFIASILYLIQERNLKTKAGMHGFWSRSAGAGHHRRNRLQVPDLGFSVHDAGADRGLHPGGSALRNKIFCRSQDPAFRPDVGGVHGALVHTLERGMARQAGRISCDICFWRGRAGMGGK